MTISWARTKLECVIVLGYRFDMNNYDFCAEFAAKRGAVTALDFGCGAGEIVRRLRAKQIEAFGCDAFYDGGAYTPFSDVAQYIKEMPNSRIPFDAAAFDVVVNNQVLEHVADLDLAVSEMARVLKPGGVILSIFPDRGVWREGHCGIPFLHRFPRGRVRFYYAYLLRSLGLGLYVGNRTNVQWVAHVCDWLDKWTYYRSYEDIAATFQRHLGPLKHIEGEWLDARLERHIPLPATVKRAFVNRMGGLVIVASRPAQGSDHLV